MRNITAPEIKGEPPNSIKTEWSCRFPIIFFPLIFWISRFVSYALYFILFFCLISFALVLPDPHDRYGNYTQLYRVIEAVQSYSVPYPGLYYMFIVLVSLLSSLSTEREDETLLYGEISNVIVDNICFLFAASCESTFRNLKYCVDLRKVLYCIQKIEGETAERKVIKLSNIRRLWPTPDAVLKVVIWSPDYTLL